SSLVTQGLSQTGGRRNSSQLVSGLRMQTLSPRAFHRPLRITAPITGHAGPIGSGSMAGTHEGHPTRFIQNSGIYVFKPVVPPAHRLLAPLIIRARHAIFWPGVVPGPH